MKIITTKTSWYNTVPMKTFAVFLFMRANTATAHKRKTHKLTLLKTRNFTTKLNKSYVTFSKQYINSTKNRVSSSHTCMHICYNKMYILVIKSSHFIHIRILPELKHKQWQHEQPRISRFHRINWCYKTVLFDRHFKIQAAVRRD